MLKVGIITSGGDAPGMNAAIRAVVRYAIPRGIETIGIERGWGGLLDNSIIPLTQKSVEGIIHLGGTILKTTRCQEFFTPRGYYKAMKVIKENKINALIVIGGDGSMWGSVQLNEVSGIPIIGIPATIDNDVAFTDETIGFDTAVNTCIEAIDKIRTTARSLERIFLIETMGRERGFLALQVGITAGVGVILVPEIKYNIEEVCERLRDFKQRGKRTSLIVAAEGIGDTSAIAENIEKITGFEIRISKLGYIQRGGAPTGRSRLLANLFGTYAVDLLLKGVHNKMVGLKDGKIISTDLKKVINTRKKLDMKLFTMAKELAV
ncbi:6-phosphofructokinase [Candidatus Bathyarchaeota archaeon]|nr:6-phosphofructokinase [Candidatus Bathyarchaeota archaeon]